MVKKDGNIMFEANKALEAGLDKEIVSTVKNDIEILNDFNEKGSILNSPLNLVVSKRQPTVLE